MDLKKCWWGGGVMPKYSMDLKKMLGGGGGFMPKYFMDMKKCWEGGYAKIFYGLEKMLGVCQQILCIDLKKNWGGGGGVVMPKYFIDLKKCWGEGGMRPYAKRF